MANNAEFLTDLGVTTDIRRQNKGSVWARKADDIKRMKTEMKAEIAGTNTLEAKAVAVRQLE